jgi:hypothetical protein
MSIPNAVPSKVPQWIFYLGSKVTGERILESSAMLEAAFYASIKGGLPETTSKYVHWLRKTSIAYIHEIQLLFNMVNAVAVLFYAKKLIDEVQKKYPFSAVALAASSTAGVLSTVVIVGAVLTVSVVLFDRYCKKQALSFKNENQFSKLEKDHSVEISENVRLQQKIAMGLHTTKVVLNVALAFFAKNRLGLVIELAGSGYSLLKNSQLKWFRFSKIFFHKLTDVGKIKVDCNLLAIPVDLSYRSTCILCLKEEKGKPKMSFCASHVYHQACIIENSVVSKSNQLIQNSKFPKRKTDHYTNGRYTHTSYEYSVKIPESNLPSCPICREVPRQNDCEIQIEDWKHRNFNAEVIIQRPPVNRQPLFEKLYTVYNVAQAGLTALQQYPELAGTIFKIQIVLMVTDLVGLAMTTSYACQKLKEKLKIRPENSNKFNVVAAVAIVTTVALSYFVMLQINTYLRSALILKDLLSQLDISPEELKTITMSWDSPLSHQAMQCLYINRIVASVALSFFSTNKIANLLSIVAQAFSLNGVSHLQWIKFTQLLEWPLRKIVAEGGSLTHNLNQNSLCSLKVISHFLVDPSCTKESFHLQSVIQSIYGYMSKLFDKSRWDRYWLIRYTNGVETSRKIHFAATLIKPSLQSCDCTLTPNLMDLTMSGVDAIYGNANVNFN